MLRLTLSKLSLADLAHGISICPRPLSGENRATDTSTQKKTTTTTKCAYLAIMLTIR